MEFRVLLFILLLSINCCGYARELETTIVTRSHWHIASALQIYDQLPLPKGEVQTADESARNDQLCTLCEEFTDRAVTYLANNKTQKEIIELLHKSCSKMHNLKERCITLVDYYAPLFFLEISTIQPQEFCVKVALCERVVLVSQHLSKSSCEFCHNVVTEAIVKLKDPDTKLEIVEVLWKACDAVQGYVKKCKRLVLEYAPVILVNAEQFLETKDICTMLHACDSVDTTAPALAGSEASMHAAS